MEACRQLMERDLVGTRRFAVVRDDFEQHQVGCLYTLFLGPPRGEAGRSLAASLGLMPPRERALQDRMHLDCVFSILSESVCIMLEEMIGEDSPTKR